MALDNVLTQAKNEVGGLVNDVTSGVSGIVGNITQNGKNLYEGITNPSQIAAAARKALLPLGGSTFKTALVDFLGPENSKDWRVRLSIPFNFFMSSAVFEPLVNAGGLIFPYTPTIRISGGANYDDIDVTHQNYPFLAYKNSKPGDITISGDFNVQDVEQAKYWIAVVHFLRSSTKMFTGGKENEQGSPPPILSLNAYGDFVFKKVPVVIKSFDIDLPKDCDYISTKPKRGLTTNLKSLGISAAMSQFNPDDFIGGLATMMLAGEGESHVPVKSTISVTLQPVYSREAVKQFSLQAFVNGQYIMGGFI